MDILNPEDNVDFSEVLYDDMEFAKTLYGALNEDGILAVKLGPGRSLSDPPEQWTRAHHVAQMVANLEQVGFSSIQEYEESHGGMLETETSSFLVAFKSFVSQKEWSTFANEALVQIKLQERLVRTKSGELPLTYVDAATLLSYQMPSRTSEVMFCRNQEAAKAGASNCKSAVESLVPKKMETCTNEVHVPETTATLMKQRGLFVPGLAVDDQQSTEVYNPFRTRNALVNACAAKSDTPNPVAYSRPSLEMTLTPVEKDTEQVEESIVASCDSRRPNLTTATGKTIEEGACSAAASAAAQALYDQLSA